MPIASTAPIVLVVTDQHDLAADKIILELHDLDVEVVRLDTSATPLTMDCRLVDGRWHGTLAAGDAGRQVRLERVGAVLWRRAARPPGHPAITDPDQRAWAATEDQTALGVLRTLPAYWMSHPDRLAALESAKAQQLVDAARLGLAVPDTLVTTHGEVAGSWMAADPGPGYIYKAFKAPYRPRSGAGALVEATRVTSPPPPGHLGAAGIFQPLVDGTPIRVTVVGEQVFAVAVHGDYDVDWRIIQAEAELRSVQIPPGVREALTNVMAHWGLTYGALDFIRTHDGAWTFLEINPTGAFGFVEDGAGLPIAARIAATLASQAHTSLD